MRTFYQTCKKCKIQISSVHYPGHICRSWSRLSHSDPVTEFQDEKKVFKRHAHKEVTHGWPAVWATPRLFHCSEVSHLCHFANRDFLELMFDFRSRMLQVKMQRELGKKIDV